MNLNRYLKPINPAPQRIQDIAARGVIGNQQTSFDSLQSILDAASPPQEGIWRANDGTALIVCNTEFSKASAAMIDWWFGWHLPKTERYQLWHPTAHKAARVKEDRSQQTNDRERYIGNESYVDEYIGNQLKRLTIEFVRPESFGFHDLDARGATAICAFTHDRWLHARGGQLCHLILPTENGCQMRSGFILGGIRHHFDIIHSLIGNLYNSAFARRNIVTDQLCIDLLLHCGEEMVHLSRFLPEIYSDLTQTTPR